MITPEDILKLRVFAFPEQVGHISSSPDYKNLTALQLAYIFGVCTQIAEEINKELETRFDPDRAYLLTEFGKISVSNFNEKVEQEKTTQKENKLKKALDLFINKYSKPEES